MPNIADNSPLATTCSEPTAMPTGERWLSTILHSPLPETVRAGETITLDFENSYLLIAYTRRCGDNTLLEYPTLSGTRPVQIAIDDNLLLTATCPRECEIELTIPENLTSGAHTLSINWDNFQIIVE